MSRYRTGLTTILVLTGFALGIVPGSRGDEPVPVPDSDLAAKIEAFMEARVKKEPFSGSILVARDGVPIFRRGYGMANLEHDVPNLPETKFRLGSVTKQFTAAAILLLQEKGKLDVHEKIKKYLPNCPEAWDPVTVHHLLTHTSGVPSYTNLPGYLRTMREPTTPDGLIARFKDRPLTFKPGERFAYSNSGYTLLGRIIEEVSGVAYADFVRENIFVPLKMDDSGYDSAVPVLKHRASGYRRMGERTVNAPFLDMSVPFSAGALYSTVDDLSKWDRALDSDRLLSKDSIKAMYTPALNNYGYGWFIKPSFGRPMVGHEGSINGFSTDFRRFPEDHVCIVLLSNVERIPMIPLGNALSAIVFGKEGEPTEKRQNQAGTRAEGKPVEPAREP